MKKLIKKVKHAVDALLNRGKAVLCCNTGDAAVETLGKIIIAIVLVAAVILVVRSVAPNLFTNLFDGVADAISDLWT